MTDRIEATSPESGPDDWLNLLSSKRRVKVEKKIACLRKNDTFVSEILATEFVDKVDVIVKRGLLEGSKTSLRKEFREITRLRNALAHANVFAATRVDAEKVPRTVEAILAFMDQLR